MVVPVGRDNRAVGSHHSQTYIPGRDPNKTLRLGRHGRGHKGQHGRVIPPGSLLSQNRQLHGKVPNLSRSKIPHGRPPSLNPSKILCGRLPSLNPSKILHGRLPNPSIQVLKVHSKVLCGRTLIHHSPSNMSVALAATPGVVTGHSGGVKGGRRATALSSGRSLVWRLGQDSRGDSRVVREEGEEEEVGNSTAMSTNGPVERQVRSLHTTVSLCKYHSCSLISVDKWHFVLLLVQQVPATSHLVWDIVLQMWRKGNTSRPTRNHLLSSLPRSREEGTTHFLPTATRSTMYRGMRVGGVRGQLCCPLPLSHFPLMLLWITRRDCRMMIVTGEERERGLRGGSHMRRSEVREAYLLIYRLNCYVSEACCIQLLSLARPPPLCCSAPSWPNAQVVAAATIAPWASGRGGGG